MTLDLLLLFWLMKVWILFIKKTKKKIELSNESSLIKRFQINYRWMVCAGAVFKSV